MKKDNIKFYKVALDNVVCNIVDELEETGEKEMCVVFPSILDQTMIDSIKLEAVNRGLLIYQYKQAG
jgi:hypothetical protein